MSGSTAPTEHVVDAMELQSDGYVYLFRIDLLPSGFIAFTASRELTWQGITYDSIQCKLGGLSTHATEQVARPRLEVQNPDAVFSPMVRQGGLEGAQLTRYRLLRDDAENNRNIFIAQSWRIARVVTLNRIRISIELRERGDGPNFIVPAKTFSPPDFPVVNMR